MRICRYTGSRATVASGIRRRVRCGGIDQQPRSLVHAFTKRRLTEPMIVPSSSSADELAGRVAWQVVDEDDLRRALVPGEVVTGVVDQRVLVDVATRHQHGVGLDRFALVGVGHAEHADLGDRRMALQHLFDLGREHVEARHDDQVLGTVDQVQVPVAVHHADVAGAEPPIDQHALGHLGFAVVAVEHIVATHPDLTGVAHRHVLALVADEAHLLTDEQATDRAGSAVEAGRTRHDRRRLGEAVPLVDRRGRSVLHAFAHGVRQSGRTGQRQSHGCERVVGELVEMAERHPHRGSTRHHRDLPLHDRLDGGRRVESLDEEHRRADGERHAEHDVESEDVEQREDAVHHVARSGVRREPSCPVRCC